MPMFTNNMYLYRLYFKYLIKFKRKRKKKLDYKIICLGQYCLPSVLTTYLSLRNTKANGELTLPFDLSYHRDIKKIIEAIQGDFKDYFEGLTFNTLLNQWCNPTSSIEYNHDHNLIKEEFIETYRKRIENFRAYCQSEKAFFLFAPEKDICKDEIQELYHTILKKRNNKAFKLIILCVEAHQKLTIENTNIVFLLSESFQKINTVGTWSDEIKKMNKEAALFCKDFYGELKKIIR